MVEKSGTLLPQPLTQAPSSYWIGYLNPSIDASIPHERSLTSNRAESKNDRQQIGSSGDVNYVHDGCSSFQHRKTVVHIVSNRNTINHFFHIHFPTCILHSLSDHRLPLVLPLCRQKQ